MKRVIILFFIVVLIALALVYILIPSKIKISRTAQATANREALYRKLANVSTWKEWWIGRTKQQGDSVIYSTNGFDYLPGQQKTLSIPVSIRSASIQSEAELTLISDQPDLSTLHIETAIPTSSNPFRKISLYLKSRQLGKEFSEILEAISNEYAQVSNVYDFDIQKKHVVDSNLVFTATTMSEQPGYELVYEMVEKLEKYIAVSGASATGFPMLNVYKEDNNTYLVKVALPVNMKLPDAGDIHYRWMLGGGNILITEVKGGPALINRAHEQIQHYISDYRRIAPAIHFESLVTNRLLEKDTNKWITRIFYPVM